MIIYKERFILDMKALNKSLKNSMDYIEHIIDRMSNDSFKMESYLLAVLSIIITVIRVENSYTTKSMFGIIIVILILFAADTCYLGIERSYRHLYGKVQEEFIYHNGSYEPYELKINKCEKYKNIFKSIFSFNILFYLALLGASLLLL